LPERCDFANELNPIFYPKGVSKFKTIEEANQHRETIEIARAKKGQAERMQHNQACEK